MRVLFLLKGEGVVILAGLAVSHQVTGLLTEPEQRLGICSADGSMVPAIENNRQQEWGRRRTKGKKEQRKMNNKVQTLSWTRKGDCGAFEIKYRRADSQLAFQGHGGVNTLPKRGAAVIQWSHFGIDQTATGVSLQRPCFPLLSRRHSRLFYAIKLDCNGRKYKRWNILDWWKTCILKTVRPLTALTQHSPVQYMYLTRLQVKATWKCWCAEQEIDIWKSYGVNYC